MIIPAKLTIGQFQAANIGPDVLVPKVAPSPSKCDPVEFSWVESNSMAKLSTEQPTQPLTLEEQKAVLK